MPDATPAGSPARSALAALYFSDQAAAAAQADWYKFVLEEINGLGTLLRYQLAEQGPGPAADGTKRRIQKFVETIGWDMKAALKQTWAFVDEHLHEFDDAWGPHLVLKALEPEKTRVQDWIAGLEPEARAAIESTLTV